jgi:hypothetical protein
MKMKNKRAEQIAAKKRHRAFLKSGRRTSPSLKRAEPSMEEKPLILIVCEGKNTEPSYFRQFRVSSAIVKAIGEGYNTASLVNRAIVLAEEREYEKVWCVFDKDDFDSNEFNNAISIAEGKGFGIAYSNQAFEYWIILHFDDHQGGGMHRNQYDRRINDLLKPFSLKYDGTKRKVVSAELFELMSGLDEKVNQERVQLAIARARRNLQNNNIANPALQESSTTVFRLVEELISYL